MAEKLAELRTPDGAVRPDDYRHALREVASRCLYGVDINPMAVELCRVALWLETVDPGKPLGFLNHHIRTGNSLLGTTPDLIAAGLPDDTFTAIEGDDKAACAELKKRNKKEREGFGPLFEKEEQSIRDSLRHAATQIEAMDDSQPAALQQKEAAFTTSETAPEYRHAKLLADLWCAAFVIKKHYPVTSRAAQSAPSPNPHLLSPIEGHLLHTEDDLFGQPTPAAAPKPVPSKQPRTKNQEQGTAWGITTAHLRDFVQANPLPAELQIEVESLARQYRFFHWHLAFPQVFDQGGFACILGNPPWERVKLQEKEWFAERSPQIAEAPNTAARKRLIAALLKGQPRLWQEWISASRRADGESLTIRQSGIYPLCGKGDLNTYALFAELNLTLLSELGRAGFVVPTGIATDDTTKEYFTSLVDGGRLVSLLDFQSGPGLFGAIGHGTFKFCLLTVAGRSSERLAEFSFYSRKVEDARSSDSVFALTASDFALLNPNTRNCPTFRSRHDAEINLAIYRRTGVLWRESVPNGNSWGVRFLRMFDMANDSKLFREQHELEQLSCHLEGNHYIGESGRYLPLFEAKMVHHFDHRAGDYRDHPDGSENLILPNVPSSRLIDPNYRIFGRYWVSSRNVDERLNNTWNRKWFLGWRDVTKPQNERTIIASLLPRIAVGHKFPLLFSDLDPIILVCLYGSFCSFALDYAARQKVGSTSLTYFILKQLPVLPPSTYCKPCGWTGEAVEELRDWLLPRVLELTYTAWDLEAFASDCGWSGPPFRWDEERRFLLRCELDAAFFHLYLGPQNVWQQQPEALTRAFPTPRHAVSYIMDTFPIVKRKDEAKHGHYRTKETILQIYDALGEAIRTGLAYQTHLNPSPADPSCCHPPHTTKPESTVIVKNWQDAAFVLLAPQRKKVHDYRVVVWPELLRQLNQNLDFETFRKAYWLLSAPAVLEKEGKQLFSEIPVTWWQSRKEALETKDFIPTLKGSAILGDLKIWREQGVRKIRWTGSLPENPIHEAVDDSRIALQIAAQWSDAIEISEQKEIESLLLTLETA
ncbi:MAG: hypothetical protein NTY98_01555 [Verrucomicrobia bacterium]|nr:hypothetical protein [Verrucomicrobiota bacterium]